VTPTLDLTGGASPNPQIRINTAGRIAGGATMKLILGLASATQLAVANQAENIFTTIHADGTITQAAGGTAITIASPLNVSGSEATPASASATCTKGAMRFDANYIYMCIATDTWKRADLTTW
jgi:hypothetical protein